MKQNCVTPYENSTIATMIPSTPASPQDISFNLEKEYDQEQLCLAVHTE
jgi:hypothetical protein